MKDERGRMTCFFQVKHQAGHPSSFRLHPSQRSRGRIVAVDPRRVDFAAQPVVARTRKERGGGEPADAGAYDSDSQRVAHAEGVMNEGDEKW
jgi:hypothetical protein